MDEEEIELRTWNEDDLPLMKRLLGDPDMTVHLGGPESPERLQRRLERYVQYGRQQGTEHMYVIVRASDRLPLGSVGYWRRDEEGETVWEAGWHTLPEFQGKGIATRAMRMVIERARADKLYRYMHAYPSVDNAASNAICRKTGFVLQGAMDFEYPPGTGTIMRCNDWRLDLSDESPDGPAEAEPR